LNGDACAAILAPEGRAVKGERVGSILVMTLRFALATVLAVAAFAKARSFSSFRRTVEAITPWRRGATAAAVAVVATEVTLAALLASGVAASVVAAVTLALFLGFAALSFWAARSGLHVRCNCFGASDRELGKDSLATSLLLAGATLAYLGLLQRGEPSLSLGELPLAVVLGITAVLGGRWLLAARGVAGIVRQRRQLESDLAR
jgi:uncharacterized membrane protein YphA (DoxX/SURF4 family)